MFFAFLLLAVRCFYLQFFENRQYSAASLQQQQVRVVQSPQRGAILDSHGGVLAASNKYLSVFAEPRLIDDVKEISEQLQAILDMKGVRICEMISESNNPGYVKLKGHCSESESDSADELHYGIGVKSHWERSYPMGRLASSVVGFTSSDGRGLGGIELQYDDKLRGKPGQDIFLADARPFRRPISFEKRGGPKDGAGIILTLDATIQQFVREELVDCFQEYGAESAVAVVMEPESGAILAMVSLPDFSPEKIGSSDPNTFRNRAISDYFEPGSVLKPIGAAIAIDSNCVGKEETIFCEDGDYRGRGFGRIGEYGNHRFGDMSVREIIVHSSNIGMAKIGQRVGKDKLYKGLQLFGFGRKTGLRLPGEVEGVLREVSDWTGYSVTRIPFGQEISVTAIQLVRAFCILANGGHSVRPFLVRAMVDADGEVIKLRDNRYTGAGFVVEPAVADWIVRTAMVGVVEEGTGTKAALEDWQVFGKTGTANVAKRGARGYSASDYVSSFVGGAPAEAPAVVVLVSVIRPDISLGKGYTGGTVAAPVVREILRKTLNYLQISSRKK